MVLVKALIRQGTTEELRRVNFESGSTYDDLCKSMATIMGKSPAEVVLKYTDDEGDLIRFTCNAELQEAISLLHRGCSSSGMPILRIEVTTLDQQKTTKPEVSITSPAMVPTRVVRTFPNTANWKASKAVYVSCHPDPLRKCPVTSPWYCNMCRASPSSREQRFRCSCDTCDFDLCKACYRRYRSDETQEVPAKFRSLLNGDHSDFLNESQLQAGKAFLFSLNEEQRQEIGLTVFTIWNAIETNGAEETLRARDLKFLGKKFDKCIENADEAFDYLINALGSIGTYIHKEYENAESEDLDDSDDSDSESEDGESESLVDLIEKNVTSISYPAATNWPARHERSVEIAANSMSDKDFENYLNSVAAASAPKESPVEAPVEAKEEEQPVTKVYQDSQNGEWTILLYQRVDDKGYTKFYDVQLTETQRPNRQVEYEVFKRWGRVGGQGMSTCKKYTELEEAKRDFAGVFKSKTGNDWANRSQFKAKENQYKMITLGEDTKTETDLPVLPTLSNSAPNTDESAKDVPQKPAEPDVAAEEEFAYTEQLEAVRAMGFQFENEDTLKALITDANGDLESIIDRCLRAFAQ